MIAQLVALAAAIAVCWLGTRWVRREVSRVDGDMKRAQRMLQRVRHRPVPHTRLDPMYRHFHAASWSRSSAEDLQTGTITVSASVIQDAERAARSPVMRGIP